VAQVVEHLPYKLQTLSSNPSMVEKKNSLVSHAKNVVSTGLDWIIICLYPVQKHSQFPEKLQTHFKETFRLNIQSKSGLVFTHET
jgi:hypothetical protein